MQVIDKKFLKVIIYLIWIKYKIIVMKFVSYIWDVIMLSHLLSKCLRL